MMTLEGAALLHVAAEFGQADVAALLLDAGADVDATALVNSNGIGGQTAIFHAATQGGDLGVAVVRLLLARGADLSVRCQVPGHYERPEEIFDGTVLEYARLFPESGNQAIDLLTAMNSPSLGQIRGPQTTFQVNLASRNHTRKLFVTGHCRWVSKKVLGLNDCLQR